MIFLFVVSFKRMTKVHLIASRFQVEVLQFLQEKLHFFNEKSIWIMIPPEKINRDLSTGKQGIKEKRTVKKIKFTIG